MAPRLPLVLGDDAGLEQLQAGDDLSVPTLEDRTAMLERRQRRLEVFLLELGFELPAELVEPNPLAAHRDDLSEED